MLRILIRPVEGLDRIIEEPLGQRCVTMADVRHIEPRLVLDLIDVLNVVLLAELLEHLFTHKSGHARLIAEEKAIRTCLDEFLHQEFVRLIDDLQTDPRILFRVFKVRHDGILTEEATGHLAHPDKRAENGWQNRNVALEIVRNALDCFDLARKDAFLHAGHLEFGPLVRVIDGVNLYILPRFIKDKVSVLQFLTEGFREVHAVRHDLDEVKMVSVLIVNGRAREILGITVDQIHMRAPRGERRAIQNFAFQGCFNSLGMCDHNNSFSHSCASDF